MRRTLGFSCFMSVFLAADDVERDVREAFSLLSSIQSKGDFVGRSCGFLSSNKKKTNVLPPASQRQFGRRLDKTNRRFGELCVDCARG